ncbi:acyltransferase [Rickenella mellea]|uniref:Acyltransferase n=1 Tax=Rickenella mellea TaxID=50990 RepID=A0A4Y7Q0A5_9AGAM|nr:acyltransferase [Rickenella mellea]
MAVKIVYRVLRKISDWALWAFYSEVCIEGEENVPEDGPLILSPTHHNEIIDIATLSATVPYRRMISYWAKSSLFSNPVTRAILLSSGSIPVDRRSKDNQRLFKGTFDSLSIEEAVGIYPEGTSYTEPRIVQVKDGVGWAALEYLKWAKEKNFSMKEVVIVPVGIVYTDKSKYQSRVYVKYGKPIFVANYAEQFLPDVDGERRAAVKRLCHSVEDGMVSLSVNAPNWDILHCSRLARDLLWGDEKNIPLRQFVVVSQTLVDIFSDQNPSPELVNLKSNLLHYYSLLHYSGLTHTSLVGIPLTFSPRPLRVVFSLMQLTALEIFNLPSYAVPLIVHLPSYILASMGARLAKDEEEARAQYKVVFGGLALAVTYPLFGWNAWKLIRSYKAFKDLVPQRGLFSQCIGAAAMAWWLSHWHNRVIESNYNLYKQYKATWKVLLGILSNGLSQSSVQPYTIPPPPPINPFIKRTSSTPDPVRKAPPPVPSRRLIHHLLRARVAAYISCGVFFQGLERSGELVKPADLGETRVDGTGTSVDVDSVTLSSSTVERSGREVVAFLRKNRADFEGLAKAA